MNWKNELASFILGIGDNNDLIVMMLFCFDSMFTETKVPG